MKLFWKIFLKGLAAMVPLVVTVWVIIWLVVNAEAMLGGLIKSVLPEHLYVRGMGVVAGLVFVFCVGLLLNMVIARMIFHRFEAMLNRLPLVKSLYGAVKDLIGFFMDSERKGQQVVMVTLWPEANRLVQSVSKSAVVSTTGTAQDGSDQPESNEVFDAKASDAAFVNVSTTSTSATSATSSTSSGEPLSSVRQPMKLLGLVTRTDFSNLPAGIGEKDSVAVYVPMSYQLGGFTVIVNRSQVEPVNMSTEDALRFSITAGMNRKTPAV